jgi:pimeloyl-ACP methyl ester carboxylesterase
MAVLIKRNVATLLLFGEGDIGLDAVVQEFGGRQSCPNIGGRVRLHVLPDTDHLISLESSRRAAAQCMRDFLQNTMRESHAA